MLRSYPLYIFAIIACILPCPGLESQEDESVKSRAIDISMFFRASRKVISDKQEHINNTEIGFKSLTGENVAAQAIQNYRNISGKNKLSSDISVMIKALKEVMDQAQPLINLKGRGFKGFLPAVFARQVATKFSDKMQGEIFIKLTAPEKYLRNRKNRADSWESQVFDTQFSSNTWIKDRIVSEVVKSEGQEVFRLMLPEYYDQSCLQCHGEPKNSIDVTGGLKEGGQLGELGGAISVGIILERKQ